MMTNGQRWVVANRELYDAVYKPDPSPPDVPDRPGWIYVVSSPDMPGLLKVGLTVVTVAERVKGLSANSSTPRPLVLEYSIQSSAVDYDEWHIHKRLKPHHHGKEWFRVELVVAIAAIDDIVHQPEPEVAATSYDNLMAVIHG